MARYQAVRGTFDVLPNKMSEWHRVEETSRDLAHRFGYREIRTPLFEEADLFTRGMGVMAGVIEKELWTFKDKFGQKLALRTDATTGVIRAFQENKLYNSKLPLKVYYLAPVFLLGKEGENRSRQSHQFGVEAIGSSNPALDAEVIALASAYCEALGLEDYSIRLNSLGGKDCRREYRQKLKDYFGSNNAELCSTCKRKYKANPDWVLSCEEEGCKALSQVAPTIYGMLTNDAKAHFGRLREYLQDMELPVELDPRVVRDSEYYNDTVFEIRCQDKSLGFGGRYDTLVEKLGGKSTPAVGFALSIEAILEVLKSGDTAPSKAPSADVLLRPEGPESAKLLVPLLFTLRQRGVSAELDYAYGNGRRSRDTGGCAYLVTLDESNAFRGNAILRDVEENTDEKVPVLRLRNRVLHVAGVGSDEERDGSKSGRKKLRRGRRKPDEDRKSEGGRSSRDENGESESGRSRRTRKRKGRGSSEREREPKRDREAASENQDNESKEDSVPKSTRGKRGSREKESSREPRRRERTKAAPADSDQGKAIVPVFGLGGPAPKAKAKAKAKSKAKAKGKAKKAKASKAASGGGLGLNWSILPGKEG